MKKTLPLALYTLDELKTFTHSQIRGSFGGKALGLFEAFLLKIPVPPTYLFPIEHYEEFLETHSHRDPKEFKKAAITWIDERFGNDLRTLEKTLYAVRSSSQYEDAFDHSFAGIFESKLNVEVEGLSKAIADVWESCFSLRVNSYIKGTKDLRMGVIIQPMVVAKYAGVAFSKHPSPANVYENQNVVIEFAPQSGEKIVQGEVTPFRLTGTLDVLLSSTDSPWVSALLQAMLNLKEALGYETDIEFVIDQRENFWLVQQRPVSVMHTSRILDLTFYQRKYKRALMTLDAELLIEGCSSFLPSYLEIPYQMERWMVMATASDGIQELWVHQLLDNAVVSKISQRIQEDTNYLTRIEERYQHNFQQILKQPYSAFFDKEGPLQKRFFAFCEFILPLQAHYYVPMFMIDALHSLLLQFFNKIDPKNGEEDLFRLGTLNTPTLMEILYDELRNIRDKYGALPLSLLGLENEDQKKLSVLANLYGFLKCRSFDEKPYTKEDLFLLLDKLPEKEAFNAAQFESLKRKYINTDKARDLFENFRKWMGIRNQEMEFLMYALLKCRPLFLEIAETLRLPLLKIWNSSRESLLLALSHHDSNFVEKFSTENLVIFRSYGKTRLNTQFQVIRPKQIKDEKVLKGKTVYGKGRLTAFVKRAFSVKELEHFSAKENYVLVAGMTTPDFIPFLREHFAALVTDEGGILCHAAIVAREIPIPCIVGTGMATEILQEGAKILIDFDTGEIFY